MSKSINLTHYLKFWSEFNPKSTVIRSASGELSYRQLFGLVKKVAGKLYSEGVRPGQVVYINLPQLQEIVVFLALHMIGAKCAHHFSGYKIEFPVKADFWIKSQEKTDILEISSISLSQEWWTSAETFEALDINLVYSWDEKEICYYMYTSGTTGSFKCIGLSYSHLIGYDAKTTSPWDQAGLTFSLFGWSGGFSQFLTTLIIKGREILVSNSPSEVQKLFAIAHPNVLLGSPALIAAFLEAASSGGTDLSSTHHVVNMGGQLSPNLFLKIREKFSNAKVTNLYGSSEGGRIAAMRVEAPNIGNVAGAILPEAEVQIVDKLGNNLPNGTSGIIRYRPLVQEYINDPEASALAFQDGWFYCGDLGHIDGNNFLVLEGRESEVLNIGGEKLDPLLVDQFVLSQPGIKDCGTFAIQTDAGRHATGIAVVSEAEFDSQGLKAAVLAKFPNAVPLVIIKTNQIPKTQMGKIMRKLLSNQFQESKNAANPE